jgi:hypothetical protein
MTARRVSDRMTPSLKRIEKELKTLPREAYDEWVRLTPRRSGNARRRTVLRNDTIVADYPYAQRLEQGWSDQAPNGMAAPTEKFIRRRLKSKIRK